MIRVIAGLMAMMIAVGTLDVSQTLISCSTIALMMIGIVSFITGMKKMVMQQQEERF